MNYKADGTPFWNQFFVAALRDDQEKVRWIDSGIGVLCAKCINLCGGYSRHFHGMTCTKSTVRFILSHLSGMALMHEPLFVVIMIDTLGS